MPDGDTTALVAGQPQRFWTGAPVLAGREGRLANVRARAPLRLGLAGGGTDLSPFCDRYGGAVLNVTIDRYAFAHITFNDDPRVVFRARDLGVEETHAAGAPIPLTEGLILHKAVYQHMVDTYRGGEPLAVTVSTSIDAPAGSGLGSSSALVVALVEAFRSLLELPLGPYDVARLAFEIERIKLGLAGGRQDQYAAAFGGLNYIEFLKDDAVVVNPLRIRRDYLNEVESSFVICFTGQSRRSDRIVSAQISGIRAMRPDTLENLHRLKEDAGAMKLALQRGDTRGMAEVLNRSWASKKKTADGISTPLIDRLFEVGLGEGAWAGKISGAGGGGFIMFCTDPDRRHQLITALNAGGGEASSIKFSLDGAEAWSVPQ